MKNYISIILTAAMTLTLAACTAAPDPAPLANPRRSQRQRPQPPRLPPQPPRLPPLPPISTP